MIRPGATAKVDHPPHYSVASPIAVPALLALGVCGLELSLECIETLERYNVTLLMNPYTFNACKYLWRCDRKGSLLDDLKKAAWYLERGRAFAAKQFEKGCSATAEPAITIDMRECLIEVQKLIAAQERK